jgi:OOP family OmpA-OmpF porin
VQITRIGADEEPLADTTTETLQSVLPEMAIPTDDGLPAVLENTGHMALSDLRFESGSSTLGPGPFESLVALSDYLLQNPDRRIALVGHTDSSGSLEGNIALSRQRATSVQTRLIEAYGVPSTQLEADGTGYLAPIASNLTAEGREANRRVEAVLLSTE